MDRYMQSLIDAPLANPGAINLPQGKRRLNSGPTPQYHGDAMPALTDSEVRARREKDLDRKLGQILDYYADKPEVSFATIAAYTKLDIGKVTRAMKLRGREV